MTHTYAILEISRAAYDEIRRELDTAGYQHAIHQADGAPEVIDMHGIAVRAERRATELAERHRTPHSPRTAAELLEVWRARATSLKTRGTDAGHAYSKCAAELAAALRAAAPPAPSEADEPLHVGDHPMIDVWSALCAVVDEMSEESRSDEDHERLACAKADIHKLDPFIVAAVKRELAPPAPAGERLAWLIETGASPTTYWDGRNVDTGFTNKADDACRFARFEDAEMVRCWLIPNGLHFCRSVEHAWSEPTPACGAERYTKEERGWPPPRRAHLDLMTPAERAIYDAARAVEALPSDVRLTDAVVLLAAAREAVADYVDGIDRRRKVEAGS